MKKKFVSLLLVLVMCLGLLPVTASAAEANLPDWYFLFAIFKNVDADGKDGDGKAVHIKYTMTQKEIEFARNHAREFEAYMNQLGVIRAHVEVVEIDETVTELSDSKSGSYISSVQATPFLEKKVDLDRYDHITCIISFNMNMGYKGKHAAAFQNGTSHATLNYINETLPYFEETDPWPIDTHVHELLHLMEQINGKFGAVLDIHLTRDRFYSPTADSWQSCYTDIILNRVKGDAETGTGVLPLAWQYPPHVMRTMTELTVPSSVASIGSSAFRDYVDLTSVTFSSGNARIGDRAFWGLNALTRVTLPDSMTSIGYAAFWDTGVTDVYYAGTEAQWKAIQIGDYNEKLTRANIHYNHLMADVKTTDWFAQPVVWALEKGITSGTGEGKFSPNSTCTQGQILTFLWRACGSPEPSGKVSGSEYYAVPLQWAKEQKLVDESLSAKDPCTRANVVTYLWKLAGSPSAKAASFTDVPASTSYAGAVNWAVENKITSGTSETTFSPEKTCTRGQIVTFLRQALAG